MSLRPCDNKKDGMTPGHNLCHNNLYRSDNKSGLSFLVIYVTIILFSIPFHMRHNTQCSDIQIPVCQVKVRFLLYCIGIHNGVIICKANAWILICAAV